MNESFGRFPESKCSAQHVMFWASLCLTNKTLV